MDSARVTEEATEALNDLLEAGATRGAEREVLRDRLSEWHRASSSLHREAEVAEREAAVRAEERGRWASRARTSNAT